MKKFLRIFLILSVILLPVAGLSAELQSTNPDREVIEIPALMNRASKEQRLKVELEENASTGYTWEFEVSDPQALTLLSREATSLSSDPNIVGGPSSVTWLFSAQKTGPLTLIFRLYRSWEGEGSAVDVKVFNILLNDKPLNECGPQYIFLLEESSATLKVGELARVMLEENASTGYFWNYSIFNPDVVQYLPPTQPVCESEKGTVTETPSTSPIIGAPSKVIFDFLPLKAGTAFVQFNYFDAREEGKAVETLLVAINVVDN